MSIHRIGMKETLVIQSSNEGLVQAESFCDRFCDSLMIGDEEAIISMAVLQALRVAINYANSGDVECKIHLEFGSCPGGIYFQMINPTHPFDYSYDDSMGLEGFHRELFSIHKLSDNVFLSDDRTALRLEFRVSGLESPYAKKRQHILQQFMVTHAIEA